MERVACRAGGQGMRADNLILDRRVFSMTPGSMDVLCQLIDVLKVAGRRKRFMRIAHLILDGYSYREIGHELGLHHSQVGRELKAVRDLIIKSEIIKVGFWNG